MPFDEDDKDDSVWFLDHDYLENMYGMFKKVNGKFDFVIVCMGSKFHILYTYFVLLLVGEHT